MREPLHPLGAEASAASERSLFVHADRVPSPAPELSSLHTTLGDLVGRLAAIATEQRSTEGGEVLASELFAIEGALMSAHRRLGRALLRTR